MRRTLVIAVAVLAGWIVLADMLVAPVWLDSRLPAFLLEATLVLGAVALLFGVIHLGSTHGVRLVQRQASSVHSGLLVVSLVAAFAVGVAAPASPALAWIFRYLYTPLQATMLGLMTFVLVSAVYRAARLRQRGALTLVGVGLVLLLMQVVASTASAGLLPSLRDWALAVPVTAGMRGILLGIALGTTASGLRILMAIDHPYTQSEPAP